MNTYAIAFSMIILFTTCGSGEQTASSDTILHSNVDTYKIEKELLLGLFEPEEHPDFIQIPQAYASRPDMYLRKEVWEAYLKFYAAAKAAGFELKILSATRNFDRQKAIWERKWNERSKKYNRTLTREDSTAIALDILKYSSMPGTSRHHWGTDIDLNSLEVAYFESGRGKSLYIWLKENAPDFGFCQPYIDKSDGRTGYEEEKWHWSYMPVSVSYNTAYIESVAYKDICCFKGDSMAEVLDVIQNFVLGIDPACL